MEEENIAEDKYPILANRVKIYILKNIYISKKDGLKQAPTKQPHI